MVEDVVKKVTTIRLCLPRLGTRKLYHILGKDLPIGRDKLFAILRANHMLVKPKRSYHTTTNSHHRYRKHRNLIEDLAIVRPEQVWVSDITYVSSGKHHNYLALITDAYSKKIMGYDLSDSLSAKGSIRALRMALRGRKYSGELIHHSDRGVQYCCNAYQKVLRQGIRVSMTESYDPYTNAIAERVNGILKDEFMLEDFGVGLKELAVIVRQSIHAYNNLRPHLSCQMLTPTQMHLQDILPRVLYKNKYSARKKSNGIQKNITNFNV